MNIINICRFNILILLFLNDPKKILGFKKTLVIKKLTCKEVLGVWKKEKNKGKLIKRIQI